MSILSGVLVAKTSNFDLNKPMYKIVFDNGKPYEQNAYSNEDLKEQLKEFYLRNKEEDNAQYDAEVFNDKGEDISESQFIKEMISEIIEVEE